MRLTRRQARPLLVIPIAVLAAGMARQTATPTAADTSAPAANVLAMDVFAAGNVVDLLLFEDGVEGKVLRHQRSVDGAKSWAPATTIDRGGRGVYGHHRGSDPQIVATGDRIVVMWDVPAKTKWGTGPLATAVSTDGGRTWAAGPSPSDAGTGEHGFFELAVDRRGMMQALWLDSRDGEPGLRGAASRDGGRTWARTVSIDTRTCECCWNKAVSTAPGSFSVLYRDKDPRDMGLAVSDDGGATWTRRGTVGAFKWGFDGCPHVGGGLAETVMASTRYLHAAVWTGAESAIGVHLLRSESGGRTWSTPRRVGSPAAKHADLAGADASVAAVWDDRRASDSVILGTLSRDHGQTWSDVAPLSASGQTATHPLVVSTRSGFVTFWTERTSGSSGPSRWRSAPVATAGAQPTQGGQ